MFAKKIEFIAEDDNMSKVWPRPKPASRFIPDEYKKLTRLQDGNILAPTVKACIPFLDSLTAGYIIPFEQDYVIEPVGDDFSIFPASKRDEDVDFHNKTQLPKDWQEKAGQQAGKFMNKWVIKTPPGYSCLFVPCMNRVEERFKIIEGVVDTDTYHNIINFPFILLKRDKQFLLEKGEPMVQVIPFKRESWKMWSGFKPFPEQQHAMNKLQSKWRDKYKTMFWQKKSYK